jgi:hypothetical protein
MERTFETRPQPLMAACTQGAAIHSKAAEPGRPTALRRYRTGCGGEPTPCVPPHASRGDEGPSPTTKALAPRGGPQAVFLWRRK